MGITEVLKRIWLFSAKKVKSSESVSKQPTQLIVKVNSSLPHMIVTLSVLIQYRGEAKEVSGNTVGCSLELPGAIPSARVKPVGWYCSIQRNIQQYYPIPPRLRLGIDIVIM